MKRRTAEKIQSYTFSLAWNWRRISISVAVFTRIGGATIEARVIERGNSIRLLSPTDLVAVNFTGYHFFEGAPYQRQSKARDVEFLVSPSLTLAPSVRRFVARRKLTIGLTIWEILLQESTVDRRLSIFVKETEINRMERGVQCQVDTAIVPAKNTSIINRSDKISSRINGEIGLKLKCQGDRLLLIAKLNSRIFGSLCLSRETSFELFTFVGLFKYLCCYFSDASGF